MRADGLSCRQAGALFNVRRFDTIAEWERAYSRDGIAGLMPHQPKRRALTPPDIAVEPLPDSGSLNEPSRQALLDELEALRTENAYLKKLRP
ncbi:hypothetical protein [Roseateles sp.]|uniref:hypothetical protein n=1 Tax=Roseateles sp. TaxID=1971397 RepID=UPI004035EAA3